MSELETDAGPRGASYGRRWRCGRRFRSLVCALRRAHATERYSSGVPWSFGRAFTRLLLEPLLA